MNVTIYPNDLSKPLNFRGHFNSQDDCTDPENGDVILTASGTFVHTGNHWSEVSSIVTTTINNKYDIVDRYYHQPEQKMIPVSTCRYCGAPVNNDGECEYCGIKHQYIFN